jgi:hypothetical protein
VLHLAGLQLHLLHSVTRAAQYCAHTPVIRADKCDQSYTVRSQEQSTAYVDVAAPVIWMFTPAVRCAAPDKAPAAFVAHQQNISKPNELAAGECCISCTA